jgi:hypothetical protein
VSEADVLRAPLSVAVIIASVGRPEELGRWRDHVARQTMRPTQMIWVVNSPADLPGQARDIWTCPPTIVHHARGSAPQRNAGLDAIDGCPDIIAFFDDDYVPSSTCIEDLAAAFLHFPNAIGLTGTLLADGVNGEGLTYPAAEALITAYDSMPRTNIAASSFEPWEGLYGCNMALRASAVGAHRFDERLPLYGWQEDVDFAVRVAKGRPLGRTNAFVGVHQGVKRGRTSGRRFGYSQITNPAYLCVKGSMTLRKVFALAGRNFLANHLKAFRPEPWVDRRGRVVGNWLALLDLARGRITPERILEL